MVGVKYKTTYLIVTSCPIFMWSVSVWCVARLRYRGEASLAKWSIVLLQKLSTRQGSFALGTVKAAGMPRGAESAN